MYRQQNNTTLFSKYLACWDILTELFPVSTVRGDFRFSKAVNSSRTYRVMNLSPVGVIVIFRLALQFNTTRFIASCPSNSTYRYEADCGGKFWKVPASRRRHETILLAQRIHLDVE